MSSFRISTAVDNFESFFISVLWRSERQKISNNKGEICEAHEKDLLDRSCAQVIYFNLKLDSY